MSPRGRVVASGGPVRPQPPATPPEPPAASVPEVKVPEVKVPPKGPVLDGAKPPVLTGPRPTATTGAQNLEEAAVELAREMLLALPLRAYSSGNSGVELHLRQEMVIAGEPVPISVHFKVVIIPGGWRSGRTGRAE